MKLKIGELAARSGVTVRALHHYDSIGLLRPSARSDAGYRLYERDDIARLHQVQALRRFGMSLADVGTFLASPGAQLPAIVDQQIAALARQIAQADVLRDQLCTLRAQLADGREPDLANWLTTLELMTMYDNYFSKEELARLPFAHNQAAVQAEWDDLVARVKTMLATGVAPASPEGGALAFQWMTMLERDTGGNPDFVVRLMAMQRTDPAFRQQNGITPEVEAFVQEAFTVARLALFEPYLLPHEYAYLQANYRTRSHEWPHLIARIRTVFDAGVAATDPQMQALTREWLDLSRSYSGDDPATQARMRDAYEKEARLKTGSWIADDMKEYLGQAIQAAHAADRARKPRS